MSTFSVKSKNLWPLVGLLAWLIPGMGHFLIGRPVRAAILFVSIVAMFLVGLGIGGVFTINPRLEPWWQYAQLGAGTPGLLANMRQNSFYDKYAIKAQESTGPFIPTRDITAKAQARQKQIWQQRLNEQVLALLAKDNLALTSPAAAPAVFISSVAGLMNIMCAIDAIILCMLGAFGEPVDGKSPELA